MSAARVTFREATPLDIEELALEMRAADRREIIASDGPDIAATLQRGLVLSASCIAARCDEGLIAVFGCAAPSLIGTVASPWLLSTPLIARHSCTLGKVARRYVREMSQIYPLLANFVDARNRSAIRLIEWLGFNVGEPAPYGAAGLPFRRFEMRRV